MAIKGNGRGNKSGNGNGEVVWPVEPRPPEYYYRTAKNIQYEMGKVSGLTDYNFLTMNRIRETKVGRWEIFSDKISKTCAIINNIYDGASLTLLSGKRILEFSRHISPSPMTGDFLGYLYAKVGLSSHDLIYWLTDSTPDQIESERLIFSLTKGDRV